MTEFVLATFTSPQQIGTNPQEVLWILPLVAAIAIVYKAAKLPTIKFGNFIKESVTLFGSIIVFIIIIALCLYAFTWLAT